MAQLLISKISRSAPKWMCVSNSLPWGSPTNCILVAEMPSALIRVDKCLIISLEQMPKPWFQSNHRGRMKHTAACSSTCVGGGYWETTMLSVINGAYELNFHWTVPSRLRDPQTARLVKDSWLGSSESTLCLAFGNRVVSNPLTNYGSSWIAGYLEVNKYLRRFFIRAHRGCSIHSFCSTSSNRIIAEITQSQCGKQWHRYFLKNRTVWLEGIQAMLCNWERIQISHFILSSER